MQGAPEQRKRNRALCAFHLIIVCLVAQAATAFGLNFNVTLVSLTNHNTSAYAPYNETNFAANFGATSWINQNGATMTVDPTQMDESLNPITPGHVSKTDVHSLIPSRPDLRWFAHATPWFGGGSHINIGLTNNTTAYVAAMITDMKNRGFNGVVIDWYGEGNGTDGVTQKIKSYLAGLTSNTFTYIIMVDKGVNGGTGMANLQSEIQYCQSQYFSDPNYEHEPVANGQPILMFFGIRSILGQANMAALKADTGGQMVWVEQGTSYLGESWEDECFEWTDQFNSGVNNSDPFNLSSVTSDFSTIKSSGKKAFGAMCAKFNGTLTKTTNWSLGKYLPCSNGLCEVERASSINSAIPSNMTRMQWATWSDWEEGTQVESGIENYFALTAQVGSSNTLSWTITSGDERTVDHYEIYASADGVNSAFLGSVPTGTYQTNLSQVAFTSGTYQVYVDAVAKPCIRDHMSPPASLSVSASPVVVQSPTSLTVSYGGTAVFNVGVAGSSPFSYLWYDQNNNLVGTNSSLVISNATHGNKYFVTVTNPYGTNSSTAAVLTVTYSPVVLTDVQPLFQTNWQSDPVSLSVAATGVPPLSYQWTLNGHNITRATNSAYSFAALAGTNFYKVTIKNNYGSANSSTGLVVGLAATFPNLSNYNGMPITFSGYTNGATLLDFPVLIRLSTNIPGFSYAQFIAPSNGADLRFTSEAGRQLFFQIDQWNPAGESQIWVQVPSLSSSNDYITACWGNAADSALLPCNTNGATWTTLSGSNNFTLAYHLSQSGFPYADATLQYPALSGVAPSLTNGMIGNGCAFNGASQFLDAGLVNIGKTFTVSAWVNIAPAATSEQTIWCNKSGGWNTAGFDFYVNSWQTNDGIIYFDTADGVTGSVAPRTATHAVTFGQWHLLSGTMDGVNGSVHVYVDGVDETVSNSVDTAFQVTNYVRCGALLTGTPGATGSSYFNGSMDDVRIENGVCSPAWVWASWATMAESNFATYGSIAPINIALNWQMISNQLVLTWTSGTLQSASAVTGPYTNISGATSPYTNVPSAAQQYFRVKVQ
jgi:hypothetical protein